MGLELLREADMILNQCGRPTPPPGVKFVDLPRLLSYQVTFASSPGDVGFVPSSEKLQNKSNTLFLVDGVGIDGVPSWRLKWPSGRSLSQNPFQTGIVSGFGANQYKLAKSEPIPAGSRITVEGFGPAGVLNVRLWGRLRYLVHETGAQKGAVSCIVGYPSVAQEATTFKGTEVINNPVRAAEDLPMYPCAAPNGNIMAPEYLLGNQCTPETPKGFIDWSYSFASDPITVATDQQSLGNGVVIPGNDIVCIRRFRPLITWEEEADAFLSYTLRTPSGFSVTGGDFAAVSGQAIWIYLYPELVMRGGDRLILDVSNFDGTVPEVNMTTIFEFEGVKRWRA